MLSSHEESDEDLPGEGVLESPVEFSTPTRARRPAVDRAPPVSTPQRSPLLKGKARPLTIQSPSGGPMLPFLSPPHYSGGASRPPMELRPRLTDRLRRPVSHGFYKGALEDPEGDVLSRVSSGFLSPTPSAARRNPLASLRDMRGMAFDMPRGGAASVPLPDVASSWGRGGARSVAGRSRMVSAAEASLAAALSASLGRDHAVADEGGGEDAGAKAWDQAPLFPGWFGFGVRVTGHAGVHEPAGGADPALLERNKTTLVVTKLGAQVPPTP
ncbi:hypothetical protein T484DRAFT_1795153 [Baffinella frigidus]|nr:hypothetical protein T484DRAFT_1795153 [Cryptophyta sp. CCMP2293]